MSNLSDLATVAKSNSKGIEAIGALMGTIADISSVVGVAFSVVSLVESFDGAKDDLDQIQQTIQTAFEALNEHQRAADTIARLTNLDNQLAVSKGVVDGLRADMEAHLSAADMNDRLEKCAQTLEALSGNAWFAPYDDQVYWTDFPDFTGLVVTGAEGLLGVGYCLGPMHISATPDGEGNVFSYIYVLPAYLYALALFLGEAVALDSPDLIQDWGAEVIAPAEALLSAYHEKIANEGLVSLSPVPYANADRAHDWDALPDAVQWTTFDLGSAIQWFSEGGLSDSPAQLLPPAGMSPVFAHFPDRDGASVVGIAIEYGVVDKFSGYSEMSTYVIDGLQAGFTDLIFDYGDHGVEPRPDTAKNPKALLYYQKFQVRLLKKKKDAYRHLGLLDLWKILNTLRALLGTNPAASNQGDWSLRELGNIFGPNGRNAANQVSLRSICAAIVETPPYDVPSDLYSSSARADHGAYRSVRGILDATPTYDGVGIFRSLVVP